MLNRVELIGNLGADPETRHMPDGGAVVNITLATSRRWKDRNTGEKREAVEWHRIIFFGKLAEIAGEYLKKGSQVYVEGRLKTRKWQDKDGVDRYTTEIVAGVLHMLGGKRGEESGAGSNRPPVPDSAPPDYDDFDDDIPF